MSGAIVTASGEAFKGYHQCPNVLRDKYMPKIGIDGYAFLNYLLSWANAGIPLSVRRMKRDLGISQDRLERIQTSVLHYCPFISMTPGGPKQANRWHVDAELLWGENALHMAERFQARRNAGAAGPEGVPVSGTLLPSPSPRGVPVSGTPSVPAIGTPRTGERYTLNTSKKHLEKKEEEERPARNSSPSQVVASSSSFSGVLEKETGEAETGVPFPVDLDSEDLDLPLWDTEADLTAGVENETACTENVPGAGETFHNQETPSQAREGASVPSPATDAPAPAQDAQEQAVNARINQLVTGRWLKGKGDSMAWIEEGSSNGVDRAQIARLLNLSEVEDAADAARERLLRLKAAAQTDPSVRVLSFYRLVVLELESAALERQHQRRAVLDVAAPAAAPAPAAPKWKVGQRVRYLGQAYTIEGISERGRIALYDDTNGSADVLPSDWGKLHLIA